MDERSFVYFITVDNKDLLYKSDIKLLLGLKVVVDVKGEDKVGAVKSLIDVKFRTLENIWKALAGEELKLKDIKGIVIEDLSNKEILKLIKDV